MLRFPFSVRLASEDRLRKRLITCSAAALFLLLGSSAVAKPKIYKSVPTRSSFSVTRAADGTITAKVSYISSDPRCLAPKRFKRAGQRNLYPEILSNLFYGGSYVSEGREFPAGAKGFGRPPNLGTFKPVTPFGKSPLVWEGVFPGNSPVEVTNLQSNSERHYTATVAEASSLEVLAAAPVSKGQGLDYFKVAFDRGGKRVILKCEPFTHTEFEGFSGSYLIKHYYF
jgi:hypothetical protein